MKCIPLVRGWRRRVTPGRLTALLLTGIGVVLSVSAAAENPASSSAVAMKNYVIIFRQGPVTLTESESARRQQAIVSWAARHQAAGHHLEPRALDAEVRRPGLAAPAETAGLWPIVALVFLEARDLDEAAGIAEDHPAKHYQVSTEVRPWIARKIPGASP